MAQSDTILAIDSAFRSCSAALWKDGEILAAEEETTPNRQAALLVPLVERIMRESATDYSALSCVACTTGPGSFTGIRIGMATAKAIALAAKVPFFGVTTLEAIAWMAATERPHTDPSPLSITVAMNAYRGEVYVQSFSWQSGMLAPAAQICALRPDEAVARLPASGILAGDAGALLMQSSTNDRQQLAVVEIAHPSARAIATLVASTSYHRDNDCGAPVYIRPPDAKLPVKAQ